VTSPLPSGVHGEAPAENEFLCIELERTLSLSGACQEDVAASTSVRHAGLSQERRLADARPKLSGRRSSSTVLSQVCLGLPVLKEHCRYSNSDKFDIF